MAAVIGVRIPPFDGSGTPSRLVLDPQPGTGVLLVDVYQDRVRVGTATITLPSPTVRATFLELELVGLFTMAGLEAVRHEEQRP